MKGARHSEMVAMLKNDHGMTCERDCRPPQGGAGALTR
jgi:hypothetical protein